MSLWMDERLRLMDNAIASYNALDKIPPESSPVVASETERVLGAIDLRALVTDLGRVGGFIRDAHYSVGAAGHKLIDQQIKIQCLNWV